MNKILTLNLSLLLLFLVSCDKNELEYSGVSRTIIVYMAAHNDLSADAMADIEEMKQGFFETGSKLIIFVDIIGESPYLLEIEKEKQIFIKSYPELNSADPVTLSEITKEIICLYPAEEYGLILWSHGTSWLPAGTSLRSFGKDIGFGNNSGINIPELAESLPLKFSFIIMDACLMGSVEVVYELRDKANFIISSSTETIYTGFPYVKIIPQIIKSKVDFKKVGELYFDYYNNLKGPYRSATISVIDTKYLGQLCQNLKILLGEGVLDLSPFNRSIVQRLDIYEEQYFFDLSDFIYLCLPDIKKGELEEILKRVVIYKAHTPWFLSEYEINTYCGLSCYIPHSLREDLNNYYKTLQWYKDSGMDKIKFM